MLVLIIGGLLGYLYGPYWGLRKVPGPPSLPLVGHLLVNFENRDNPG